MATGPTALLLDIQSTQSRAHGQRGIARYTTSLATELLGRPGRVRRLLLNPEMPAPSPLPPSLAAAKPPLSASTLLPLVSAKPPLPAPTPPPKPPAAP